MSIPYSLWEQAQVSRGVDIQAARERFQALKIELPSWGFGNAGTRFKTFKSVGAASTLWEKLDDAAVVNRLTGMCPTVAIHIPWDKVDDYNPVKDYADERGVAIGAVNPNLFQDEEYKFGSLTNSDPATRRRAVDHMLDCVDIMGLTGSTALSLWLSDGTNYPGQGDFRARKAWLDEALRTVADRMADGMRMLIEYKVFEPAFYHTDLADWGCALWYANRLGKKGEVLVDLGHHSQGVNVEFIVAFLLDEGKLGGFHFNNRKYADDDLIVGSINPYELFLIFNEIVAAQADPKCARCAGNIAYMIDQCHYLEPKIPAMIRSVLNIQTAYAKALLVNRQALAAARAANDSMAAEACVREAFEQDVTPLLLSLREQMGVPADPLDAYGKSGYQDKINARKESGGWD